MVRNSREEWKTRQGVFDKFTERLLFKLSSQGHFDELNQIVSPGKEAVVFVADKGDDPIALKIYKLQTAKFSKMYEYIRVDPRYERVQKRSRQVTFAWAEREYRNLLIARKAGVHVPVPITHRDNILVMEFIGNGHVPSPLLHYMPPEDPESFVDAVLHNLGLLVEAGFVHGDLSEYNIINHNEQPVLIDFSHCAPLNAPNSMELLERDVKTLCKYFAKIGVPKDPKKVLKDLTLKNK